MIFTESKNRKPNPPKKIKTSKLPPREYDGATEESGIALTPSEAIDIAQGLDN